MAPSFRVPLAFVLLLFEARCAGASRYISTVQENLSDSILDEFRDVRVPQLGSNILLDVQGETHPLHTSTSNALGNAFESERLHINATNFDNTQHESKPSHINADVVTSHETGDAYAFENTTNDVLLEGSVLLEDCLRSMAPSFERWFHHLGTKHASFFGIDMPERNWLLLLLLVIAITCCCFYGRDRGQGRAERKTLAMAKRHRRKYLVDGRVVYEWDQTDTAITVYTKPPGNISTRKIEVLVWPDSIYIGRKGKPPFLEEDLYAEIDPKCSSWFVSSDGELQIALKKVEEGDWPCVIAAHQETYARQTEPNLDQAPFSGTTSFIKTSKSVPDNSVRRADRHTRS